MKPAGGQSSISLSHEDAPTTPSFKKTSRIHESSIQLGHEGASPQVFRPSKKPVQLSTTPDRPRGKKHFEVSSSSDLLTHDSSDFTPPVTPSRSGRRVHVHSSFAEFSGSSSLEIPIEKPRLDPSALDVAGKPTGKHRIH